MADSYIRGCAPGTSTTIADLVTTPGGASVSIRNMHASVDLYITGSSTNTAVSQAFPIAGGKTYSFVLNGDEAVYGWSSNATVTLSCAVFRTNFRGTQALGS